MVVPCAIAAVIALATGLLGKPWQGPEEWWAHRAAEVSAQRPADSWTWKEGTSEAWFSYAAAYRFGWYDGCSRAFRKRLASPSAAWYKMGRLCGTTGSPLDDSALPSEPPKHPAAAGDRDGWQAGCFHVFRRAGVADRGDWCATHGPRPSG